MQNVFGPALASFLGFDPLFSKIEHLLESQTAVPNRYPPLNLYKDNDGGYSIEMALAGFKKSDIRIEHDKKNSTLIVSGDTARKTETNGDGSTSTDVTVQQPQRLAIHQSIATRRFVRTFTLSEDLEVQDANLEDGLLTIKLYKIERPEDKPLLIQLR